MTKHFQDPINVRIKTVMPQYHCYLTLLRRFWPLQHDKKRYDVTDETVVYKKTNKNPNKLRKLFSRFHQLSVQNEVEKKKSFTVTTEF